MHIDSVRRFLVTAPDDHLTRFHLAVALRLNGIERRAQTVFYTCMAEDADFALQMAKEADVTVQEIAGQEIAGGEEAYPVRHLGSHGLTWVRPSLRRNDLGALWGRSPKSRIGVAAPSKPTAIPACPCASCSSAI